jgi:hypothetical protein
MALRSGWATIIAVTVAGLLLGAGGGSVRDLGMERLQRLGVALRAKPVWQAKFEQEFIPVGMTVGETAAGRVWLAWPDRALFHTGSPPFRLMGLEGRVARLVDLEAETCDEHRLSDREWERVPLAAVLDPGTAVEHFTVVEHGARGFDLTPREAGGIDRVEVVLGDGDLPAEVVVVDPQGAVNRLRFTGWRASPPPPDGRWLPPAPDTVECVSDLGTLD